MFRKLWTLAGAWAIVAAAAALLITGCSNMPDNAAATVNGVIITKDDVASRIRVAKGLSPQKVPSDTSSKEYHDIERGIAGQLVAEEVERQEFEKRGLTISTDEINEKVNQVIEDKYFGSIAKMEEDFSKRGITDEDLRGQLWRQLAHIKILESLRAEVPTTDEEVRAEYDKNISAYVYPEKRQVRQILLADEATARVASTRIAGGEDFIQVAKQVSIDAKTRDNGGLIGLVAQNSLTPAVAAAAFSLGKGEVSMPFKGEQGWYIVKVDIITPAANQTFDQVKDQLKIYMSNQRVAERYKTYLEEIKPNYDVVYADDYKPVDKSTDTTATTETLTTQP
ncbi:MAG: peptidyl-prolyl cis-trans isomerase [Thermoleophilia bacterium]